MADPLESPDVATRTARGAGLRLVAYALGTVLSVASAAVLLRYLGVADYGRYVAVFALVTIVAGVTEAGTANVGVRELATRPDDEHERVLGDLQGVRLALTTVGALLAFAFAAAAGFDVGGAALAGAGMLVTVFALTAWIPLQARLELARVAAFELARQALTVLVLLALVAGGAGVAVLLGAQVPVGIALAVAGIVVTRRSLRPRFDVAAWRALLADTLPYAAATAIGLVYSSSVVLVMGLTASAAETGLYGAAARIFTVLGGVAGILIGSVFPILARRGRDDRDRLQTGVHRLFDVFLTAATGLALVTAAGAPVAIDVIAGDEYERAVPVLRILAPAVVASFLLALAAFALLALNRQRWLIVINASGLAVAIALAIPLTNAHGAEGGALATVIGESLIAVLSFAALAKAGITPTPRAVPKTVLAAGAAAIPAFALGLPALAAAAAAALVYAAAALTLGLVPAEVLRRG